MSLDKIRLVLVRTFHPGNIGSAVRSAKTMGLSQVHLVSPKDYPSEEANKMAAGAEDLLKSTVVHSDLESAVADSHCTIATSVRPRGYDLPCLTPKEAAELVIETAKTKSAAVVFGPERMGLHNKDMQYAQYRLEIPANPLYSSLNLAAAVQIVCYEIYNASLAVLKIQKDKDLLVSSEEFERLMNQTELLLQTTRFLRPHQGETLMRIRHFLRKAQPTQEEVNILRGAMQALLRSLDTRTDP
ncbi:MAG: RNA methyltransferase [Pseudomonadota bacterium]